MIQLSAQIREFFIEQLDDVESVENNGSLRQVVGDRPDVGRRHVGGHGLDVGTGCLQPSPKGLQGVCPLAVADKDHRPGAQIQYNGQVPVPLACGDFIDGDVG